MKKQYEETMTQKVVSLIVVIFIGAVILGFSLLFAYVTGNPIILIMTVLMMIEFFRKDDQKSFFKSSRTDTSPYDGELVSYKEYPENADGVNGRQGFDKYRNNIHKMEDICSDINDTK